MESLPGVPTLTKSASDYVAEATRSIFPHFIGDQALKLCEHLAEWNQRHPPVSELAKVDNEIRRKDPDNKISWGVTRTRGRNGNFIVTMLLERGNKEAHTVAENFVKEYPELIMPRLTGKAQSLKPEGEGYSRHALRLAPGGSIGHYQGYPGSIGCFVRNARDDDDWIGIAGASHVLGLANEARIGDPILVPCPPDGQAQAEARCGRLANYTMLRHYRSVLKDHNYLNCADAALVEVTKDCQIPVPKANYVLNPRRPDSEMLINGVIGGDQVALRIGQTVYKIGRTTGFTKGILEIVGLQRYSVHLNKDEYMYTNVLAVRPKSKSVPFSRSGDSGALVYTRDGYGIGLVIGGTEDLSLISPLDACLENIHAKLLI